MKIALARITPFALPLVHPLATAHGVVMRREGLLLELEGDGLRGLGEASPLPGFGLEALGTCSRALDSLARAVLGREIDDVFAGRARGAAEARGAKEAMGAEGARSARGAYECALLDLRARAEGCTLAEWLARPGGARPRSVVEVNALVAGDSSEALERSVAEAFADGHRTLKLKVGVLSPEADVERARRVAALLRPGDRLRLDANAAWSELVATRVLEALSTLPLEWVEQPVAADALDAMRRLRERTGVRIAADESATGPEELARVLEAGAADCVVLKPAVAGGPAAAFDMAESARRAGVERVVTSFLDSAVGVASALHVAAALSAPMPACGLATSALLAADLAAPMAVREGRMALPAEVGLGLLPDPAALERVATGPFREYTA